MNELILIAKSLEQIANELAEIKYILKYKDNEPYHEKVETEHGPTRTSEPYTVVIDKTRTYTSEEFRRLAE